MKEAKVKARVVSLSPDFINPEISSRTRKASPEGDLVAAVGQHMPFPDETFDRIYALHVAQHLDSLDAFKLFLGEIARTLKKGGKAMIGPYFDIPFPEYDNYKHFSENQDIQALLLKNVATITKEDVSAEVPLVKVKDEYANAFYVQGYSLVLQKPI